MQPLTGNAHPGDFFQIRNGEIVFLGNIFNPQIIDQFEVDFEFGMLLNPSSWSISEGVSKPYSGRGTGHNPIDGEFEFSKQILAFKDKGSFVFKGENPEAVRIVNWDGIKDELIIKMTQTYYSFREVYVITECAVMNNWTLAISGAPEGELEIATESENFGLIDLFGHSSSKTIQSKDIDYYHRESNQKSSFFKAKKMIVNDGKVEHFVSDLLTRRSAHQKWAKSFFPYEFYHLDGMYSDLATGTVNASVLDMLQGNQLNPNTALDYFSWTNTSLDDIEKLFLTYGA